MTTRREREAMQQQFKERMNEDDLLNCMRCGFCLPACPTYIESGFQESHSPRGRLAVMKGVVDGLIEPDEDVERSLHMCLGCRACEPVCPADVNYGHLLEEARDIINQNKKHSLLVRLLRRAFFQGIFPDQRRMRALVGLISLYQRSGLQYMVRKSGLLKLFPGSISSMEKVLPTLPTLKEMKNRPSSLLAKTVLKKRVAFFSGCLMDTMFMKTNDATVKLLQLAGCQIVIPAGQACCGALHGHSGEKSKAKELAKRNILAFEEWNVDYIITNAGGCGAFLTEYVQLLQDELEWSERAKQFSHKLKDISTILVELQFHKQTLLLPEQVVTYQDSCHLRNVMKTEAEPRLLLQAIQHIKYVEMKRADQCCGSAGIYTIVEPEMSMQILDSKMKATRATAATTIVTSNPGCLLQMKLGVEREGLTDKVRVVHIVDLLLEAVSTEIGRTN